MSCKKYSVRSEAARVEPLSILRAGWVARHVEMFGEIIYHARIGEDATIHYVE